MNNNLRLAIVVIITIALASCSITGGTLSIKYPSTQNGFADAQKYYNSLITDAKSSDFTRAKAHIKLALLDSHYRNPSLNYSSAVNHFESAMSINNTLASNDHVINMHSILNATIKDNKGNDLQKLNADMETLKEENHKLQLIIDQLSELEVDMEKRRKLVK